MQCFTCTLIEQNSISFNYTQYVQVIFSIINIETWIVKNYPALIFSWSHSKNGQDIYLKIYENIAQVNTRGKGDDCNYHATSTLEVTMSEDLDGSKFMCSILEAEQSETNVPSNSDEVMLELKGKLLFLHSLILFNLWKTCSSKSIRPCQGYNVVISITTTCIIYYIRVRFATILGISFGLLQKLGSCYHRSDTVVRTCAFLYTLVFKLNKDKNMKA